MFFFREVNFDLIAPYADYLVNTHFKGIFSKYCCLQIVEDLIELRYEKMIHIAHVDNNQSLD